MAEHLTPRDQLVHLAGSAVAAAEAYLRENNSTQLSRAAVALQQLAAAADPEAFRQFNLAAYTKVLTDILLITTHAPPGRQVRLKSAMAEFAAMVRDENARLRDGDL